MKVKAVNPYLDLPSGRTKEIGEITEVDQDRANILVRKGLVEIIEEKIREEEQQ